MSEPLKSERVQLRAAEIPGWDVGEGTIQRTYRFPNFRTALTFANFVGELAEAADHHPDLDVRWGKVKVLLTTHSAGGLTDKDFDLAKQIDHC